VTASPHEVILERRARKNFAALDPPVRRRVAACIDDLAADPRPPGATELKGRPGVLRIRAGDYRILDAPYWMICIRPTASPVVRRR
jgi:mRNA interferase RelE/StbE